MNTNPVCCGRGRAIGGLWLVMVCGLAFAPRAACGSCGDYLHQSSSASAMSNQAGQLPLPLSPKPCHGPGCRSSSDTLPASLASPPPRPVRDVQFANLEQTASVVSLPGSDHPPLIDALPVSGVRAGIEHIPRG